MSKNFDTIVLGLGAMGSAAVYQLAKMGNNVLGIDQFEPPHSHGSTHGDSRITRQAIGEGEQYVPLALRSYEIWNEIEKQTGKSLLTITGGLILSTKSETGIMHGTNFFENTVAAAKKFEIRHEIWDAKEIRKKYPQFHLRNNEIGYFEYNAGFLRPEECVKAQLELAIKHGAVLHASEKVESFAEKNGIVQVTTNKTQYTCKKLIVSAGPWIQKLLPKKYNDLFTVTRQVMYWFDVEKDYESFKPEKSPIFIWDIRNQKYGVYGFPAIHGPKGGFKIASEQFEVTTDADKPNPSATQEEITNMYRKYVEPYFPTVGSTCIKTVSCLYTSTKNFGFVIDRLPESPSVIVASPCSGHGFKHSAAIGETLAQLAMSGKTDIDISKFQWSK
jgi:sarcosine oxidase